VHPDLRQCRDELRRVIDGLTVEQAEAPRGDRWSIAAILEHLDLTYARSAEGVEHRLRKGTPPERSRRSLYQRLGRTLIVTFGYFPAGRSSPEVVLPTGRPFVETRAIIETHLMLLDQRLLEAARVFGARRPLSRHPVLGLMSVSDWRRFHLAHTRHHVRQVGIG
jgi:hypothetical protein